MKFVRSALVAALVLGPGVAWSQPPAPEQPAPAPDPASKTIRVTGRVIDALGRPVRNATVSIEGQPDAKPARTGRDGTFVIEAPMGANLVVEQKAFGVGLATVTGVLLDDIVLLTEAQLGETIEINSEAPAAAPGAAQLDRKELQRIPGTGGDIVKALTAMPGVVNLQIPLGYSGVVIRGSSPQDSKVLIDDFEVPVLFHNIGFRAVTPAETIQSLDYIPGGFDVGYGRASSGIVSLTTRPGDEKRSAQAEISVIDGGLQAQGPIGEKGRYMFALRRSTIDFVLPSIIPDSVDLSLTTVPRYWDEQLRFDTELNKKWKLTVSNVGTDDIFELYATKDDNAETKRFFNRTRFARLTAAARYKDGPWQANLALSGLLQQFVFEAGIYQNIEIVTPIVTPRADFSHTRAKLAGLTDVVTRFGGEIQVGRGSVDLALPIEQREGETMAAYDPKDVTEKFNGDIWTHDYATWGSITGSLDKQIRATIGLRGEYYGRPEELVLQPRGELKIQVTKPWQLRLSAGAYSRPPEFQSEFLAKNVQSEKSKQVIFGAQYEPRDGARVQASVYYTDRTDLITHEMDNSLGNSGRGTTKGAELLATYRGGPWFAWLSYSYSNSTRVDHPGDDRRLFTFDQPHSLNAAVSWNKSKRWTFGGRFQLYSGLPYTPAIGSVFDSDRNLYIPLYADVNSERAPIHHQLDVRVDYNWKWGPTALTAFLDIQNLYMNDSVVTYFYSYDYSQRAAFKSLPLIPSIGLRGVL